MLKPLTAFYLVFACLPFIGRAQNILTVSSSSDFYISASQLVSFDSLVLTPSSGFDITGSNTLTKTSTLTHTPTSGTAITRAYSFSSTLPAFTGQLAVYYQSSELNGMTASNLQVNAFTSTWTHYSSSASTYYSSAALTGVALSEATLAAVATPLPLIWIAQQAYAQNGETVIKWTTADETGCLDYQVEKSGDGRNWQSCAGVVPARNTMGSNTYQAVDVNGASGKSWYRIRQDDLDGRSTYSAIMVVETTGAAGLTLYPIPVMDQLTIELSGSSGATLQGLEVFNAEGRRLVTATPGAVLRSILYLSHLSKGVYTLRAVLSDGSVLSKIFVKP